MPRKGFYEHKPLKTEASPHKKAVHPVIINRHARVVGELPNFTNSNTQPFHSGLEHDWLLILDIEVNDFNAAAFQAQPEQFKFQHYKYTPDVWVKDITGGEVFQEVKPDDFVTTDEFAERWELCTDALEKLGHELELVTESDIRREPRYSTVRALQAYRSVWAVPEVTLPIDDVLADGGQLPIGRLCRSFPDPVFVHQVICNLILQKHLTVNFDLPFNNEALVRKV